MKIRDARRGQIAVGAVILAMLGSLIVLPGATAAPQQLDQADIQVPTAPVITAETEWKYLDDNSDPAQGHEDLRVWTKPQFDDSAWKTASGSFGAKDGKLQSVSGYLPQNFLNHYIDGQARPAIPTYFFRTSFDLETGVAEQVEALTGELTFDDALIVWINGEKAAGFKDERVTGTTNLEYAGDSAGSPVKRELSVPGSALKDGENVVAIALYQDRESSSDIYFDAGELKLTAQSSGETPVENAPPTRVILTPHGDMKTEQSFTWLAGSAEHTGGAVQIRPSAGDDSDIRTVDAYDVGKNTTLPEHHFSATVTGLKPGTTYTYRVGTEGGWSDWYEFTTDDPNVSEFKYLYYGDAQIGLDSTWPRVVAAAEEKAGKHIGSVHAGDLIDVASNDTQWKNWFKGMEDSATTTNVFAAPGNHEYSGDRIMKNWKAHFEYQANGPTNETIGDLAERAEGDSDVARQYRAYFDWWEQFALETVYFADYNNIRFITLNATRDTTFLRPEVLPSCSGAQCPSNSVADLWIDYQAAWLDHVLETSPQKWNVVTFHQPVYSTSSGRNEPVLRAKWVPVFQKHNIDLVQMGHDHTYGRGFNNDDKTDVAGMTTGPVYAVSNSGAKHYNLETDARNVWTNNNATQVLRGQGVTTYQVITVGRDMIRYESYLVEVTSIANTDKKPGDLYDSFTITKYDDGTKYVTEDGVDIPAPEADPITVCETTPNAPATAWDADKVYQSGDLVFVDGQIFEAQWYAHGNVPGEVYGPWTALTACGVDPSEVQDWHASTIYQAGDKAVFEGETYTASWWTRGEAPGASQWGPWKK